MGDVVALLPMKGHSERVPGKNLRPLAGKPLFHWILETLSAVPEISTVVVDTDSEKIAEAVASSFSEVEIRERPENLVGDEVSMHDIVARIVTERETGDVFLQTHSTNPLLTPGTISRAISAFLESDGHDSLMSVTEWRTRLYDRHGQPVNHEPGELRRTQDLAPIFEENSNLYVATRDVIESTGRRVGANPLLFPLERGEAIDIDDEVDFVVAECLMKWRHGG